MPPTPVTELAYELRIACMRLVRRVRYHTETLPPHFFTVLARLHHGSCTAADLAARERVSAPSMSRTVTELEERGLLTRAADEFDKRRLQCTITPAGIQALTSARKERDAWMSEKLSSCTPKELATLRAATAIINKMLDVES